MDSNSTTATRSYHDDEHSSSPRHDGLSTTKSSSSNAESTAVNAVIILSDAKHIDFIRNAIENNNGTVVTLPMTTKATEVTTELVGETASAGSPLPPTRPEYPKNFTKQVWKHCFGSMLALSSGVVLTIASIAATILLTEKFNTGQVGLFRFVFFLVTTSPVLVAKRINPFGMSMLRMYGFLLLFRACMGSSAYLFRVFTFSKLPVGDATTIMFCSPIFVGIFARIFLGERYNKVFFISMVLGICGCALISRPHFIFSHILGADSPAMISTTSRLEGTLSALCSAVSTGMVVVLVRKLRQFDPSIVIFHFGFVGTIVSLIICASTNVSAVPLPKTWYQGFWIAALALSSSLGQWLFTVSLHYEHANIVSLIRTTDVMWAFLAQVFIFSLTPHWLSVLGASLVTVGVVLLGVTKALKTRSARTTTTTATMTPSTLSPPSANHEVATTVRRRPIRNLFTFFMARKASKLRAKQSENSEPFAPAHTQQLTSFAEFRKFSESGSGRLRRKVTPATADVMCALEPAVEKLQKNSGNDEVVVHPVSIFSVSSVQSVATCSSPLEINEIMDDDDEKDCIVVPMPTAPLPIENVMKQPDNVRSNSKEKDLVRTLAGGDDYEAPVVAANEAAADDVVRQAQQHQQHTIV